MNITKDIIYIGVNDKEIDLFEGQYKVPSGMCYNSYIINDEKIAVMDTVDKNFTAQWLDNIKEVLGTKTPDFLIVQHMEPDHSASIAEFMKEYPRCVLVSTQKAFAMIKQFFFEEYENRRIVVKEGDTLSLGENELTFVMAPMVHWPEVMVTYVKNQKVLFSADGFGKFGAFDCNEDWTDEARRYYIGIVGKYGMQVQALLKKAAALQIETICPLHGPVLNKDLSYYIEKYDIWSSYKAEEEGVVVAYSSVYGNTKKAALLLYETLLKKGVSAEIYDLARCDKAAAVAAAFRYSSLVLATTTYNNCLFPCMREFIEELTERNYQNRKVGIIENGTWAPTAAKNIKKALEECKNLEFTETTVTIRSALSGDNISDIEKLSGELV